MIRRIFLKVLAGILVGVGLRLGKPPLVRASREPIDSPIPGVSADGLSHIYMGRKGTPEENMAAVLELTGGVQTIIGAEDIIILKPNSQWWNQGMTNTNAMKAFIEAALSIPGFSGEIIVADNHHFPEDNSRGWTTEDRNGDYNYNELVEHFQNRGHLNVTKYHWHDGGSSIQPSYGGAENGGLVKGPEQGDGYVWCKDLVYVSRSGRKAMMSYPIFTSTFSGVTIDLKNGAWKEGKYTSVPIKLVNFSGLNHHGNWAGATASIKNYLGIVDLTCGYRGLEPEGFYNFHFVGNWDTGLHWRVERLRKRFGIGYISHFDGGAVGYFMRHVRMADLNVITAEWTGWGSRTDPRMRTNTNCILASKDPVALDYYATKKVLLPSTPREKKDEQYGYRFYEYNDPENLRHPLSWQLEECSRQGIGTLDAKKIKVHERSLA